MRVKDMYPNSIWCTRKKSKGFSFYYGSSSFCFSHNDFHVVASFNKDVNFDLHDIPIFFFPKELI